MRSEKNNIILIGMPGAGKSTVGVLLAKRLGLDFLDTDLLIQTGEGRFLQQLIQERGVQAFCDLECSYVGSLAVRRTVIATGGSVVYRPRAMQNLDKLGTILFLDIEEAALIRRLADLDERGVVRLPGQTIAAIYAERQPLYRRYAEIAVDTTRRTPEQVVQAICTALRGGC
jgi:shikimate kinase